MNVTNSSPYAAARKKKCGRRPGWTPVKSGARFGIKSYRSRPHARSGTQLKNQTTGLKAKAVHNTVSAVGDRGGHFKIQSAGVFPQEGTPSAGAGHDFRGFFATGDFENEGAVEVDLDQLAQEGSPVDTAITGRAMLIRVAAVVVHMEHAQVGGEFVDEVVEFSGEEGVAGIEAGADLIRLESSENPYDVARVAEEEVGEFVFEHAAYADLATAHGDAVQDGDDIFDSHEAFLARGDVGIFGSRVDDKIMHAEDGCGFDGFENLIQREFPAPGIGR